MSPAIILGSLCGILIDFTELQNVRSENCTTSTGEHFNLPNHSIANMNVSIVEKCCNDSKMYRKIRESFFINKFETKHLGLNRKM